jgi:HD-GYP domain-containing protein (c-di-GMP phosphodiesterase class II)
MTLRRDQVLAGTAAAILLSPMAALGFFRIFPQYDPVIMDFGLHFYAVGFTALAAALACAVIMATSESMHNTRLIFLGLAFLAIAGIFSVHGLATPGYIVDEYYVVVSASAWLSSFAGCALVALSVAGLPHRLEHMIERNGPAIVTGAVVVAGLYIGVSLLFDAWLDWVPVDDLRLQYSLGGVALALGSFAVWRYWQAYQFARLPSQLAMIAAVVVLLEVQAIIIWGGTWHMSWWLYHGLYLIAFGILCAGWTLEARRAGTLRAIADALSMRDALAQLNRGLETPILDLVDEVEAKDRETFGHVRRVSGYALAIGKRLNLSPSSLRLLALGAEMHDVGKISIPSSVLAKPGPLSAEEFAVVKTHTARGQEIAEQVAALNELAVVIRHHHERYDGSGYPDGLSGEQIPLFSRIIAVADTYDAITSKRPYRPGRSHDEALSEIRAGRGLQFDPECVDAFLAVFREPGSRVVDTQVAA